MTTMTKKFPVPPYPYRDGMTWDMNGDFLHIFDNGAAIMTISLAEINCMQRQEKNCESRLKKRS
jgi:hypothetical protein